MSILSPLTAVVSAIVPLTVGLIGGERLGVLGYVALALALVAIVLVGFDMHRDESGAAHFFGEHPPGLLRGTRYEDFLPAWSRAARELDPRVSIVNATPGSALKCFRSVSLSVALWGAPSPASERVRA
jgi:hypothetical protein